jgi:hypothetical protein
LTLSAAALPLQSAHIDVQSDPRIIADIARRLADEAAFATWPPAPQPTCHWLAAGRRRGGSGG